MYIIKRFCLLACGILAIGLGALGNQYTFTLPLYVKDFSHYNWYTGANTNHQFLEQFNVIVTNMILNANRVAADNFREVMDASTFKQISQDSGTNSEACQAINKLWVRDFINELNLYKMDYIVHRYQSASMQLLKEPMDDTVFLDIGFDEPLDKMVTYFWAYHLKQAYDVFMHNASQMHTKWEKLKEKINTSTTASE